MDTEDWVSPVIDVDRPSAARIYDYHLDGGHNFRADRRVLPEPAFSSIYGGVGRKL